MRINLLKYKGGQFGVKINKQYGSNKAIIPIGCDCHPAYVLYKTKLRDESLPFDWLDIEPLLAMQYVYEMLRDSFRFFLADLSKNEEGKVYSKKYPEALFYHFDDLQTNIQFQNKIKLRINRLVHKTKYRPCCFLHNTTSEVFKTEKSVVDYMISVKNFITLLKPNDELLIYLRYDESLDENKQQCELLLNSIKPLKQCTIVSYIRKKAEFGLWGDENKYKTLINDLGIKYTLKFPKIEFFKIQINN
ncbi:DUF1796 family putative cysteine peptidase [Mariniflexile soesokkakense]|uniref:DUF1796 family putative cysteine peptidase n=1 Tax=Mariniflexile soesokkakense TaxID=1343160 RepID=A0ABV0A6A0_9FLAO